MSMDDTKAKQSQHGDNVLDKFYEVLKQSTGANNKVKINEFKSASLYLPPIANVFELLGFPSTYKQLQDLLETTYQSPLKISRSSKYEFFGQGIGLRAVSKIINWLKNLPVPFERLVTKRLMAKILRSNKVGSNAGNWFSALNGFEAGFKSSAESSVHEFEPLYDFIRHRCSSDVDFLTQARQQIKDDELDVTDAAIAWKVSKPLWENNSLLSPLIIEKFDHFMAAPSQPKPLAEQQTLTLVESYCFMCLDFYFEAITTYEVGCRFYYDKNPEKRQKELGMITKSIYAYATDDNIKTCFDGLLKELKDVATELVGETSYRKLASFIAIEEDKSSASGNLIEGKQYNQLKDWRSGKNLPSNKKLSVFLAKLDEYANTDSGFLTFLMCRIAMGMDKLVDGILVQTVKENCNQADVETIIKKVLAKMPDYYNANLQKQLDKR